MAKVQNGPNQMWNWGSNMGLGWEVFSKKKWLELIEVFRPLFYFYFLYTSYQKPSPKGKPKLYGPHKQGEVQVLSKGLQSI